MKKHLRPAGPAWAATVILSLLLAGCGAAPADTTPATGAAGTPAKGGSLRVLATETFLADIAQNVAGSRLKIDSLVPMGVDPHSFEPSPGDATKVAQSNVLVVNGAGVEAFLDRLLKNAGGQRETITASAGLVSRTPREGEAVEKEAAPGGTGVADPHFWLDPTKVVRYVENIRDGLSRVDAEGSATYAANADAYVKKLQELDAWIAGQVEQVPPARRLLVTNHEAFGYYADRYGFKVVGTVIPSVSSEASPSARELARLIDQVKATHAPAIFLESGTNPQLAQQVAQETGAKLVTDLFTHSTTGPNGPAPTYIDMLRYDTQTIVNALK